MSENPLFRKAALDKLASPERLDVLMQVTSPMGWLALTTVGGILVGVIVWSILGSIPERIDGQGVLLRGGANKEIRSTGSGTLASPQPEGQPGRSPSAQVLGTITAAGNNEEVNVARTKVQQLENQRLTTERRRRPERAPRRRRRSPACAATSTSSASTCSGPRPKWRASSRCSRTAGSRPSAWKARAAPGQRRAVRRSPASTARSRPRRTAPARRRLRRRRPRHADSRSRAPSCERVEARVGSQESLTSTVGGRVIEVRKKVGDTVAQNDVVAMLEDVTANVQVVAFVAADVGKRIKAGMNDRGLAEPR